LNDQLDERLEDVSIEDIMNMPVEVPAETKRKRRKYRKYPKPECTIAERQALMELQGGRCGICGDVFPEKDLMTDHSYRTGKTRGLLCRQHNAALGFWKDSPTMLKKALAYLKSPPGNALGLCDSEKEKIT
jgi:Recombination endonuclease VII